LPRRWITLPVSGTAQRVSLPGDTG